MPQELQERSTSRALGTGPSAKGTGTAFYREFRKQQEVSQRKRMF